MRLSTLFFTSLRDDPAEADMVSFKQLGMRTIVIVAPRLRAAGGVERADRASGERSVRQTEDVEAELRGAA